MSLVPANGASVWLQRARADGARRAADLCRLLHLARRAERSGPRARSASAAVRPPIPPPTIAMRSEPGISFLARNAALPERILNTTSLLLTLRTRAAWAHDYWSSQTITAKFVALPGLSFTGIGAIPGSDFVLVSAGGAIGSTNGFTLAAWFDSEFAEHARKYAGTIRLRYLW